MARAAAQTSSSMEYGYIAASSLLMWRLRGPRLRGTLRVASVNTRGVVACLRRGAPHTQYGSLIYPNAHSGHGLLVCLLLHAFELHRRRHCAPGPGINGDLRGAMSKEKRSGLCRRGCGDEARSAYVNRTGGGPIACLTALTLARTTEHGVMDWLIAGYKSVNGAAIFPPGPAWAAVNETLPRPHPHHVQPARAHYRRADGDGRALWSPRLSLANGAPDVRVRAHEP